MHVALVPSDAYCQSCTHLSFQALFARPLHVSQGRGVCGTGSVWGLEIPISAKRWNFDASLTPNFEIFDQLDQFRALEKLGDGFGLTQHSTHGCATKLIYFKIRPPARPPARQPASQLTHPLTRSLTREFSSAKVEPAKITRKNEGLKKRIALLGLCLPLQC